MEKKKYQVRIRKDVTLDSSIQESLELLGGGTATEIQTLEGKFESMADALLEYRRANKIYEVGDFIIDTLIGNEVIKYHDGYKLMPSNYVSSFLMHASDAEIEVGRRLDLPESVVKSLGEVL